MAQHPQHGRQEGQREDDRAQDDERPGDADGPDRRRFEQEEAGQADGHGHAAEGDGFAGSGHGTLHGVADRSAASQFLAETAHDEQ